MLANFLRNTHNYNLRSGSKLLLPNVKTVFKGKNSISYFGSLIWNFIPFELRKASSYQILDQTQKNGDGQTASVDYTKTQYIFLVGQMYYWLFYFIASFIYCVDSV